MSRVSISRHSNILRRKNFLPTIIITILLWVGIANLIYFVDPAAPLALVSFFSLIFFALLFTFSTIFINTRRGLIIAVSLIFFMLLRYFGIGNILNLLLIAGLALTIELFFSNR